MAKDGVLTLEEVQIPKSFEKISNEEDELSEYRYFLKRIGRDVNKRAKEYEGVTGTKEFYARYNS